MTFHESIDNFLRARPTARTGLGEPLVSKRADQIMEQFDDAGSSPPPEECARIAGRLRQNVRRGSEPKKHDLRKAPWCLWHNEIWLVEEEGFRGWYLPFIAERAAKSALRPLCSIYLIKFDPALPRFGETAEAIGKGVMRFDWKWREMHTGCALFDPVRGPKNMAATCVGEGVNPVELFARMNIGGQASREGLIVRVFRDAIAGISSNLLNDASGTLRKVKEWSLNADGGWIFDGQAPAVAHALLAPWDRDKIPPPSGDFQEGAIDLFITRLGDPRIKTANWLQMEPAARVMKRWLTELSLRQFLEIVDETAYKQHWAYRRAFWDAYFRLGHMHEAWVAFGPQGQKRAHEAFGEDAKFAQLYTRGKPVEPGHAVLLMKIGRAVIADWSHNGACHIWVPGGDETPPEFYREQYGSDEVRRKTQFGIPHAGSINYRWQEKIARRIEELTGINLPGSEYLVEWL